MSNRATSVVERVWRPGMAALGACWALAACSSSDGPTTVRRDTVAYADPNPAAPPSGEASTPPATTTSEAPAEAHTEKKHDSSAVLYDPETIPKFELTFDAPAMAVLTNPNPAEETTWVHGAFKFGAITFADVGVRRKGSSTYRVLPEKASLKVKFNKWVKGQKLHGLEEITLNNMVSDPTFVAERLAYHVFRSMGLPAPFANTAELSINGEYYGIFANIESVNEDFLKRVLGAKAKTLYEVNWGSKWLPGDGVETGFEIEVPFAKVEPLKMPDVDTLLQAMAAATDATLLANLEGHVHTKEWFRHSATEALTGHYDGYAYGLWGSHNYFMAGDTDGKFMLVPWSTDLTFSDRERVSDAATPLNQTVLVRCRSIEPCWSAYKAEVQSVIAVYETLDLVSLAKKWHDQIEPLVIRDPKRSESLGYHTRETASLYDWLAARPRVVRAQLGL